jgi:hypothetical protein
MSSTSRTRLDCIHVTVEIGRHVSKVIAAIPLPARLLEVFPILNCVRNSASPTEALNVSRSDGVKQLGPIRSERREFRHEHVSVAHCHHVIKESRSDILVYFPVTFEMYLSGNANLTLKPDKLLALRPAHAKQGIVLFQLCDEMIRDGVTLVESHCASF